MVSMIVVELCKNIDDLWVITPLTKNKEVHYKKHLNKVSALSTLTLVMNKSQQGS